MLYPFYLRDTLLRTAEKGLYRARWSAAIVEEARRNLVRNTGMEEASSRRLVAVMTGAFPEATVAGYEPLIASMTNNEKDRHVVAAAVHCRARIIVTTNLKDFPIESLRAHGIEAQHPDEFLCNLFDLDPTSVFQVVTEQAADLRKPPRSTLDVLEGLGKMIPDFAERLREELSRRRH